MVMILLPSVGSEVFRLNPLGYQRHPCLLQPSRTELSRSRVIWIRGRKGQLAPEAPERTSGSAAEAGWCQRSTSAPLLRPSQLSSKQSSSHPRALINFPAYSAPLLITRSDGD